MDYENLLDSIITKEEINKIQLGGSFRTPKLDSTPKLNSNSSSTSSTSSTSSSTSPSKSPSTSTSPSSLPSRSSSPSPAIIKGSNTDPYVSNNPDPIPPGLLRIIDDGIDTIIRNIKNQFGDSVNTVNERVKTIIDKLTNLAENIDNNLLPLNNNFEDTNYNRVIIKVDDANSKSSITLDNYYFKNDNIDLFTKKDTYKETKIKTLDDNTANAIKPIYQNDEKATPMEIKTRLENCQLLEMLYLIKHEELMKTFVFTLNLFDKYKYAIKILLYILKNLLAKKDECPGTPDNSPTEIKLPATLIPNIKKLLDDQAKVQEIIDNMKLTIQEEPSNNDEAINLIKTATNNETSINTNLTGDEY